MLGKYPSGMILFAAPATQKNIEEAKKYCLDNGYTKEQVKITKIADFVLVKVL